VHACAIWYAHRCIHTKPAKYACTCTGSKPLLPLAMTHRMGVAPAPIIALQRHQARTDVNVKQHLHSLVRNQYPQAHAHGPTKSTTRAHAPTHDPLQTMPGERTHANTRHACKRIHAHLHPFHSERNQTGSSAQPADAPHYGVAVHVQRHSHLCCKWRGLHRAQKTGGQS